MRKFRKFLILGVALTMAFTGLFSGCIDTDGNGKNQSSDKISALAYTKPKKIEDMQTWHQQVRDPSGKKNNRPSENGLVISPYYTLKVNQKSVPVYTTRCSESPHSYAWIDVDGAPEAFRLSVELNTERTYTAALVLPEKTGVNATIAKNKITAEITAYGDYSFVFAAGEKHPTVENEPLTLIVAPEQKPEVPEGYSVRKIEPKRYGYDELVLNEDNTLYEFAAGEYDIRRIIAYGRKNIAFYFHPGSYFSVYETPETGLDSYGIGGPAFGVEDCENVRIAGRALFDFSGVRGWYKDDDGTDIDMTQYVFNFYRNKNMYLSGITSINSNHWTFRVCGCENMLAEWNVMFGYRNYSDGFIYSDCKDCTARNLFARTGDDGIEVKALGWHGACWRNEDKPVSEQPATNILFENCTVWNDDAAAFGVIYENYTAVDGVTFRNCSVGFTSCNWSVNNSALNVRLTYPGTAHWKNILFEGIEIYECRSNAFTAEWHLKGGTVENVLVKDVTVKRSPLGWAAIRFCVNTEPMKSDADVAKMCKNLEFENITFRGKKLTEADKDDAACCSYSKQGGSYKNMFTIR